MSMGEKIPLRISWTPSPFCLLQEWMERVCQSVQYNVPPDSVRAKGCVRMPSTTASLQEHVHLCFPPTPVRRRFFQDGSSVPCRPVQVSSVDEAELSIRPVQLLLQQVNRQSVGPVDVLVHENLPVRDTDTHA